MNANVYEEYFEQILEYIPEDSITGVDNAKFNSWQIEHFPTTAWKKEEMKQWPFRNDFLKMELLQIDKLRRR